MTSPHVDLGDAPAGRAVPAPSAIAWRPADALLLLILAAALACRLQLATTAEYIHDEENTAIPIARTISFDPGALHLPLRGENHGALPAYLVKASAELFGTTPLGYRGLHVIGGLCVVLLVYGIARPWYGAGTALWATALLAFNEYFLTISSRATAHVPHLLFAAGGIFAFSRFLAVQRPTYLYFAGACVGIAFYAKEHVALLLPVFLLVLMRAPYRRWLRRPQPYLACAVFVAVISPDIAWNLKTDPDTARVSYNNQTLGQATYQAHLRRVGGLGFSPYPAMFYARQPVRTLYLRLTGKELRDETTEYRSMNPAIGVLLVGAVLLMAVQPMRPDPIRWFLLMLACGVFAFFTLIKRGDPPYRLDPVSWIWVEITIIPAVIIAGARLAAARGVVRVIVWAAATAALGFAVYSVVSPR